MMKIVMMVMMTMLMLMLMIICSFFLQVDSMGRSRAQVATELLSELNDDVTGNFVEEVIVYFCVSEMTGGKQPYVRHS